jgi:hypothetical protein
MATGHIARTGTPRGRTTIRKGGSLTGLHGPTSKPIKLWTFDSKPGTTIARLEQAYLGALSAVDRIEERSRASAASGKFTPEGVKDDALKFALSDLVPSLHKARQTIRKARPKSPTANRSSRSQDRTGRTLPGPSGEWKSERFFAK